MKFAITFLLATIVATVAVFFSSGKTAILQEVTEKKQDDVEVLRQEQIKRFGRQDLAQPEEVERQAKALLSVALDQQSISDLDAIASKANEVANLIGFISEEYEEFHRDKYQYKFIQRKIATFQDNYIREKNKFLEYRNQAYFNLGLKHKQAGNRSLAFFYFRDAFRLSTFMEEDGDRKGMRYKAEIEMKELLGISGIPTFIHWDE